MVWYGFARLPVNLGGRLSPARQWIRWADAGAEAVCPGGMRGSIGGASAGAEDKYWWIGGWR